MPCDWVGGVSKTNKQTKNQAETLCHILWQTGAGMQTAVSEASHAPALSRLGGGAQRPASSARLRHCIWTVRSQLFQAATTIDSNNKLLLPM